MPAVRLALGSAIALFSAPAMAAIYYVDDGGNNANPGTQALPWATLQRAATMVQPGDTVFVRAGTYAGGHFTTSGSALLRITIAAFPGETPVIGSNNPVTTDGINLEGASFVTVSGFTVTGVTRAGIRAVECDGVEIRDNVLDANGRWGILTGFCDDLLIEGNQASRSAIEHGIYVSNSGDRPVIRGNTIFGNNANGIHMNGDAGLGGDGIISGALVDANVIFDNGAAGGSGINADGVQDSLFRNNLVFDSRASGISLYTIDGGGPSSNNRLLNNTVITGLPGSTTIGRWALNVRDGATGTVLRNNIFYSHHGTRGAVDLCQACLSGLDSDNNVFENRFTLDEGATALTLAQWRAATGGDLASTTSTPDLLFAGVATDDYRLAPASAALDAGTARAEVPVDLVGTARPQGAAFDIGAYESPTGDRVFADGFEDG